MNKILCFIENKSIVTRGNLFYVVAIDSKTYERVNQHVSSSLEWAKNDIGYTNSERNLIYDKKYGKNNYQIIWRDTPIDEFELIE